MNYIYNKIFPTLKFFSTLKIFLNSKSFPKPQKFSNPKKYSNPKKFFNPITLPLVLNTKETLTQDFKKYKYSQNLQLNVFFSNF